MLFRRKPDQALIEALDRARVINVTNARTGTDLVRLLGQSVQLVGRAYNPDVVFSLGVTPQRYQIKGSSQWTTSSELPNLPSGLYVECWLTAFSPDSDRPQSCHKQKVHLEVGLEDDLETVPSHVVAGGEISLGDISYVRVLVSA